MKRVFRILSLTIMTLTLTACQEMKQGEFGVVYSDLPTFLGGGLKDKVVEPGEREVVFPWEELYRVDTTRRSISWGGKGEGSDPQITDFVETRTLDGNEVDLAITVLYKVDQARLQHVIQRVGTTDESIRRLVASVARADIRTHMNALHTKDFFSPEKRREAVEQVKRALSTRLGPEGIIIDDVIYNDHRFERRLGDGTVDRSYQEQIDRTQAINQETEQEGKKVATVVEKKRGTFNEAQARVNRIVEQATGFKRQEELLGDAYLASKKNEAEQIRAVGLAEVEGLQKQIEAMKGPGGRALLRQAIAKELISKNPQFVVINPSGGKGGVELNRLDTNELIRQSGLFAVAGELSREMAKPVEKGPEGDAAPAKSP